MMTVMFLETSLRIGGTETVVAQLMQRLDRKKIRPVLACLYEPGPLGERLISQGMTVYHHLAKSRLDPMLPARLYALFKKEKVDGLFIVNQPVLQFWGTWCGILAGVPVRISAIRSTGKVNRIQRRLWINRLTYPWTAKVTALSRMHKAYLIEKEKIDPGKIEIITNGVDLERFHRGRGTELSGLRDLLGVSQKTPLVTIVAMLRPEKGHETFLRAAAQVRGKAPETHFVIVGEGPEKPKLEKLTGELSLGSQVHFLGARNDIPDILAQSDVCVLSSHPVVETVSNAVLEYMASAKPVVSTRVGSLPEMVDEGETGFLVPAGDPEAMAQRILQLIKSPLLAAQMGRAGRRKVETHYSVEQMVRKTEDLFECLLRKKRKMNR